MQENFDFLPNLIKKTQNKTEKQVFQTLKREHQKGETKSFKSLLS